MAPVSAPLAHLVGAALRAARTRAGLSQEELAEAVQISAHYVSLMERGERLPKLDVLQRCAHALDVPLGQLVGDAPLPISSKEQQIVALVRRLEPKDRDIALVILKALSARK